VLQVLPALEVAGLVEWTGTGWRLAPPSPGADGDDEGPDLVGAEGG
jgi:DNA processing protein